MDTVSGHIEHVVYTQPENGFTVARLKEPHKKSLTTIVGHLPSVRAGESITCKGEWKRHPQHGAQFEIDSFSIDSPSTVLGIKKYLESGLIKGIGPTYAERIVDRFKEETLKVIDLTPEILLQIPGIGEKRIRIIKECWKNQRSIRQVMIFLQSHGVSPCFAQKIFKRYGESAIEKVKENPYELAKEVTGIGFKSADAIAKALGYEKEHPKRLASGLEYILWELSNEGHTCYPKELLLQKAESILEVKAAPIEEIYLSMVAKNELIEKEMGGTLFAWHRIFYFYEQSIAEEIKRLKFSSSTIRPIDQAKALSWVEEKLYIQFAEEQKNALLTSLKEKLHIITGCPGTGKSTITTAILAILSKVTNQIFLCAPTGRAAKRLTQITRKKAHTIHSLLEFDFQNGGFKRNHKNFLECDLIIIDEASMIDTFLLYSLLKAIPDSAKVLFIGDIDQLPSVGPGHLLKDLISSQVIAVTRLNEIFRQAAGSKIILNAHKINQGEFPLISNQDWSDFHFYEEEEPEKIVSKILQLVQKDLPEKRFFDPIKDIQVLSPMRKGPIGINHLNYILQKHLNPSNKPFFHEGRSLHIDDKVMQIRNNYTKKIYNGDVGRITDIDLAENILTVNFDEAYVEYDFSELDELVLAYAVSVHKYQGSECPCIVMPIHTSHFMLLYRNLLYTGVTRGKKFVALVGTKKAIAIAVKNAKVLQRYTGLVEPLKKIN